MPAAHTPPSAHLPSHKPARGAGGLFQMIGLGLLLLLVVFVLIVVIRGMFTSP